jgi:iron-sulfur cluster assembly protein
VPDVQLITVSERAVARIQSLLAEHAQPDGTAIRVGIKGGGCSGFSYTFEFESKPPTKFDYLIEAANVKVLIDRKSAIYMSGTELDYETTIMKSGFVFKNPRAKSTCGCGSSFAA